MYICNQVVYDVGYVILYYVVIGFGRDCALQARL